MKVYTAGELLGLEWFGAADKWVNEEGRLQFCRVPRGMVDFLDKSGRVKVMEPSGVRLRVRSATRRVVMEVVGDDRGGRHFDLVVDGALHGRVTLEKGAETVMFDGLDGREHDIELWMNWQYIATKIKSIAVDDGTVLGAAKAMDKPLVLFYGSSITHGRQSDGPTETWSSVAAKLMGVEPINLGLGGACFAETVIARHIRTLKLDYLVCCFGINVVGSGVYSDRGLRMAIAGFLQVVREAKPELPIAVISTIYSSRFERDGGTGPGPLTVPASREVVREIVETFQKHGDKKMMYANGCELCGEGDAARLYDGLHPDAEGQRMMGRRFAEKVWPGLKGM